MIRSLSEMQDARLLQQLRSFIGTNDAALVFVIRIGSALFAYALQIALARTLPISEYGIYVTLWTWMIVLNHLATFGFSESALRFLPRYAERGKAALVHGFFSTGYKLVLLGTATVAGVAVLTVHVFADWLDPPYILPLVIVLVGLPITAAEIYLEGVSRALGWFALAIVPPYLFRPALVAASVLLLYAGGVDLDAALILTLAVLITAACVLIQTIIVQHRLARQFGTTSRSERKRLWLSASLPLALVIFIDEVLTWSDMLAIGLLLPPDDVSVYFVVHRSMALAAFVQYAFMLVMARDFAIANARRDRTELQHRITRSTSLTFWLTIPAVGLTLAAGYPVLHLFGQEFVKGYPALCVLGLAFILRAAVGQAQELTIILGHERANIVISAGCIGINVIGCILLVPHLGLLGGAISTALTYAIRTIAYAIAVRQMAGLWVLPNLPASDARPQSVKAREPTPTSKAQPEDA